MARAGLTVPENLPPVYSLALVALVMAIDFALAPVIEFPALLFLPVLYGAWYGGLTWGLPLSVIPFAHVFSLWLHGVDADTRYVNFVGATVRTVIMVAAAFWIATVAASQRALKHEVELLEGLLPICSYCKKIRDDKGDWQALEKYIQDRSDATFTHGICETCLKTEVAEWKKSG